MSSNDEILSQVGGVSSGSNGGFTGRWSTWLVVILALLLVLQAWLPLLFQERREQAQPRPITPRGTLGDEEQSTIALFRQSAKSVVLVSTTELGRDLFYNTLEIPKGTGTGFVWDEAGHIVTNFHVIRGASRVRITFNDQSTWQAQFVGGSAERDLAVLRVDAPATTLAPILVGESHNLEVGQKVFAIGNPFGLDQTLTTGIVSGLGRRLRSEQAMLENLIQTDAAINPGNSGSPLLDSAGRLIGVNTAIYSPSGASAGVGFAIPVDDVQRLVPQLIKHGRVIQPGLGARYVPDQFVRRLGLEGAMILDISEGSAAARAGLRGTERDAEGNIGLGDLIVAVEKKPVTNVRQLFTELQRFEVGKTVTLTVTRNARGEHPEHLEIAVTLQAAGEK
jgi:S1-C subfamily serine protease